MADWFRSWHGAPTDAKWRTIAKRAKVSPSLVVAIAWALMDRASQGAERGSIHGLDVETLADFMDCETEEVDRIIAAMREKCVLTDQHFTAWEKRQPAREDGSAERAKAWRELKRLEKEIAERERALANAAGPPSSEPNDVERTRTDPNADEHRVEAEQSRVETEQISAALDARDSASLDRLENSLRRAAGFELESYAGLRDLSPILGLIEAGFDVETEILPGIRSRRRKGIRSWNYFVPSIREARDSRVTALTGTNLARAGPGSSRPTRGVHSALAGIDSFYAAHEQD